jgi:hypothetical protein
MLDQSKEEAVENKTKGQIRQVFCLECKRPTRHLITVSYDKNGSAWNRSEEWSVDWADHYQILECQGCSTITFRHSNWFSENQGPDDDGVVERLYPMRKEGTLSAKPYQNVPVSLRRIYIESVDCYNTGSNTLCAAGLRALVEGICAEQGIQDGPVEAPAKGGGTQVIRKGDLQGKIAGLHEKGLLTKTAADTLHEHRYLGNSAVHELARPADIELQLAIEILEHTLDALYEMPEKAALLRARRKP